jgi:hypothetical protein
MCYAVLSLGLGTYKLVFRVFDLVKLEVSDPLLSLLTSRNSSNDLEVQMLWIIGTGVQNSPSAQNTVGVSL